MSEGWGDAGLAFALSLDRDPKPLPEKPVLFDRQFRRLVQPRLLILIRGWARLVATGTEEFSDAADAVMVSAVRLGAAYLSYPLLDDLQEWVMDELADAIEARIDQLERAAAVVP